MSFGAGETRSHACQGLTCKTGRRSCRVALDNHRAASRSAELSLHYVLVMIIALSKISIFI